MQTEFRSLYEITGKITDHNMLVVPAAKLKALTLYEKLAEEYGLSIFPDLEALAAEIALLRTGYAAARLEIESLQARIKTMAEEHADELMVAHLDGIMRAAQPAGAQQSGAGTWTPLPGTLPEPGKPVLLDIGMEYPIRAMWAAKHALEVGMEDDSGFGEYDEATDTYYCPEGWYEWNEHEETHWAVDETPTAWCELPPNGGASHGQAPAQAAPAAVGHDEDLLEKLYWEFDSQRKKTGEERLAFKVKMRFYASEFLRRSDGKMTFAQSVSDDMMNLADRLGSELDDVDPRAWKHLLVYAPKAAPAQPAPQQEAVAWARPVFATEAVEPFDKGDLVDVEFYNHPERPEGEGWRPLVFADTDDAARATRKQGGA